jgi:hypothetical protein
MIEMTLEIDKTWFGYKKSKLQLFRDDEAKLSIIAAELIFFILFDSS